MGDHGPDKRIYKLKLSLKNDLAKLPSIKAKKPRQQLKDKIRKDETRLHDLQAVRSCF